MILNKIIGYTLLVVGLAIIVWVLYQSYAIFSGTAIAPMLFREQIVKKAPLDRSAQNALLQNAIQEQFSELIPPDAIAKTFNLLSWSALAWILIYGGSQIAGIGVRMLKSAA